MFCVCACVCFRVIFLGAERRRRDQTEEMGREVKERRKGRDGDAEEEEKERQVKKGREKKREAGDAR